MCDMYTTRSGHIWPGNALPACFLNQVSKFCVFNSFKTIASMSINHNIMASVTINVYAPLRYHRSNMRSTARWAPPSRCARSVLRTTRMWRWSHVAILSATSASRAGWSQDGPTAPSVGRRSRIQRPWSSTLSHSARTSQQRLKLPGLSWESMPLPPLSLRAESTVRTIAGALEAGKLPLGELPLKRVRTKKRNLRYVSY